MNAATPELMLRLRRRLIEIDYLHNHRHATTSLSALPIIVKIYAQMRDDDVFILSKGHSCSALYAVLEYLGFKPDVTKVHPERDVANGIEMTAGSLGHGLPFAVGIAYARIKQRKPGVIYVLMGDGECLEGTTWEALHLAARLRLQGILEVYIDSNGSQGADHSLNACWNEMSNIFPVYRCATCPGEGVPFFTGKFGASAVHKITDSDYAQIMEELGSVSVWRTDKRSGGIAP